MLDLLSFGFLLGLGHATDADHLSAITTITSKEENITKASFIGILWGIGHSVSVTLVAIPVILFAVNIPPNLTAGFEFLVGIMLVILGLFTLTELNAHHHAHFLGISHNQIHHLGIFHTIRPFFVGIIHGLAGSAAVALLVLSTIKNPILSVLYLFIFHLGVIMGMMIFTTVFGKSLQLVKKRSEPFHRCLVSISGIISIVFGLSIIYQM